MRRFTLALFLLPLFFDITILCGARRRSLLFYIDRLRNQRSKSITDENTLAT